MARKIPLTLSVILFLFNAACASESLWDQAVRLKGTIRFNLHISEDKVIKLTASEELVRQYIRWAKENGFTEITLDANPSFLIEEGHLQQYRRLRQLLQAEGFNVFVNLVTVWNISGVDRVPCFNFQESGEGGKKTTDARLVQDLEKGIASAAGIFDTIIIDDFFYLDETCPRKKDEPDYAVRVMTDYSQRIIKIAQDANPKVKVIFKMPSWIEGYAGRGLKVSGLKGVGDGFLIGTEAFGPPNLYKSNYYEWPTESFNTFLWFKGLAQEKFAGGGWIDTMHLYDEWMTPAAHETILAQARVMHILGIGPQSGRMSDLISVEMGDYFNLAQLVKDKKMRGVLYNLSEEILPGKFIFEGAGYHWDGSAMNYVPLIGIPLLVSSQPQEDGKSPLFFSSHNIKKANFLESFKEYAAAGRKILITAEVSSFLKSKIPKFARKNIIVLPAPAAKSEKIGQGLNYLSFLSEEAIEPVRNAVLSEFGFKLYGPNKVLVRLYDGLIVLENLNDGLAGNTGEVQMQLKFEKPVNLRPLLSVPSGSGNSVREIEEGKVFKVELKPLSLIVLSNQE